MYITGRMPRERRDRGTCPGGFGADYITALRRGPGFGAGTLLRLHPASSVICLGRFPLTEEAAAEKVKASALW